MSKHLMSKAGIRIAAGTSPADVTSQFRRYFESAGWQVLDSSTATQLDLIPPPSSPVGNENGCDVLRLTFTSTGIQWRPVFRRGGGIRASYTVASSTSSNVAMSVRIGGQQFSAAAAGSPDATMEALHRALSSSTAPEAQAYTFALFRGSGERDDYITAVENQVATGAAITAGDNTRVYVTTEPATGGTVHDRRPRLDGGKLSYDFSINYGQDWIFYATWLERTFAMAVITTSSTMGPVFAQFVDHADAVAQCPPAPETIPIELALVNMTTVSDWRVAVSWGSSFGYALGDVGSYNNSSVVTIVGNSLPTAGNVQSVRSYVRRSASMASTGFPAGLAFTSSSNATSIFGTDDLIAPVHSGTALLASDNVYLYVSTYVPSANLEDVGFRLRPGGNEIVKATRSDVKTRLSQNVDASATTLTLTDASMLSDAGTIIIGAEIINYTSKDGNTLKGVRRGHATTQAAPHSTSEDVYMGYWWVCFNGGAMPFGYRDPSEGAGG